MSSSDTLHTALLEIAQRYPGPGGAVAILREGEIIARHSWGYASLERRIPFTPSSLFRICSITKQFTCAVMLDRYRDPEKLAPFVRQALPHLATQHPTIHHLAHNQSGLRDYWAVAMLHGAAIEGQFNEGDARRVMAGTRSLQFEPGTSYSYVNQNFRLLSNAMEAESGESFAALLKHHIFTPARMHTALLAPETRALPDGTTGYEGTTESGFRPAVNRIYWTGDAGMAASLDDMIAWERSIDATRNDPNSLYQRLSAPVTFRDGTPTSYGFGLQHSRLAGYEVTGHGGALRGWRSHRLYCPEKRLSVVVLFNHMSAAQAAASDLFHHALGLTAPRSTPSNTAPAIAHDFNGVWLDEETGLSARIENANASTLRLRYLMVPEEIPLLTATNAGNGGVQLERTAEGIVMTRPAENRHCLLTPHSTAPTPERHKIVGQYRCGELDNSELTITEQGGLLYGGFSGLLGEGRMERLTEIGEDLWTFPCPRALDHTAPGDWTLNIERTQGSVRQVRVGCWLARNLVYERLSPRPSGDV
ncbi:MULTISPECIES: D-aminopeptidase [unclassified Saccharibacter]|uniref:D-aminopeptidase n=1 Tax=unclassified Saccharibacter TaxID=2648722 RepID=UPI0013258A76|nr:MULTISPECIES: D-aminopeptidase [unclassified Saccharibacter]MXV36543.1 D-aminopeptidase [Saccharibacter sp. EH611]MXV57705.1 D-aminopeptidase [Saccharibacter sp. EH70]MXV64988.1 D-aminopeptidase [Saccharibacter sp. EH60]